MIIRVKQGLFCCTPTEAAFGTWDFWAWKDTGALLNINIITTGDALGGYTLTHAVDDSLSLVEVGVGNVVTGGSASSREWHRHRITRRFNGLFSCYLDNSTIPWGTGADLTVTMSRGILIQATGACKIGYADKTGGRSFIKYLGERAP